MADDSDAQAQSDVQFAETETDVASMAAKSLIKDLHTSMPGIIKAFDAAKQTASVQPAIKRVFVGLGAQPLPLCTDVPVVFPAGGDLVMTFPVRPGDECLLHFGERAIDWWFDQGGVQEASEIAQAHSMSVARIDGFAVVGISSKPRFLSPAVTDGAAEIRTRDGALVLRVAPNKISLGVNATQPAVMGNDLKQVLSDILDAILALSVPTGTGPSGPPINSASFTSIKNNLDAIKSAIVVLQKS